MVRTVEPARLNIMSQLNIRVWRDSRRRASSEKDRASWGDGIWSEDQGVCQQGFAVHRPVSDEIDESTMHSARPGRPVVMVRSCHLPAARGRMIVFAHRLVVAAMPSFRQTEQRSTTVGFSSFFVRRCHDGVRHRLTAHRQSPREPRRPSHGRPCFPARH